MGLFDKLTGAREGDPGVTPVPVGELRAALLALGERESFQVLDGAEHGCDLVAEWQTEVSRSEMFSERHLKAAFRVRMKFHEAGHEVRHNSQQSTSSWGGSGSRPDPGYSFDSRDITGPLRDTVTRLGWAWKAALLKL